MEFLISLSFFLAGGLLLSRVVKLLRLPNVTGYLVAGILLNLPQLFGWEFFAPYSVSANREAYSLLTDLALGFIAFSIGGEFKLSNLKKLGKQVTVITLIQAFCATGFVILALLILELVNPAIVSTPSALLLGAIAAATAPAATLMVVKQYKARGPVTRTLLPVVAGDDAIGLMIFSICLALAKVFAAGETLTFVNAVLLPIKEIVLSILAGAAIGGLLSLSTHFFRSRANRLCLILLSVLTGVILSELLDLSSLLVCMMIGAIFCNTVKHIEPIMEVCERWTPPLFMLFFVVSGAELDLHVIPLIGVVGVVYLIARSLGKYFGCYFGGALAGADEKVKKYLGFAMLPQAGVAIGMSQVVSATPELSGIAPQVVTVVLCATLIYELVGPLLTKVALKKAGEIHEDA